MNQVVAKGEGLPFGEVQLILEASVVAETCSSQTARAPRRSEAGLILLVPHSLACNPVFGHGVKYRCVQRAGSTRQ